MIEYVVGFLFSPDLEKVVLIRKTHPDWQKGLLNGPGGKVEDGETPYDAMVREFKEETGQQITDFYEFFCLTGSRNCGYVVHFFVARSSYFHKAKTKGDEEVVVSPLGFLNRSPKYRLVNNAEFMVLMARYVESGHGENEQVSGNWSRGANHANP